MQQTSSDLAQSDIARNIAKPTHTISVYVNDRPGVLSKISLVFSRRGFNIESLIVSPALSGGHSRMTITCSGDPETLDQITRQLTKNIDVIHATDSTTRPIVETEMALIKIATDQRTRSEVLQLAEHFEAKVVDFENKSMILRISGTSQKLDNFVALLDHFTILELVRTGKVVMARGREPT